VSKIHRADAAAFPKKMLFFPDCSTTIWGASRLVTGAPRIVTGTPGCSQVCRRRSPACHWRSQALPGSPKVLSGAPRCSQTYHNHSHGTPVPVMRDPSYSEGRQECPPRVWCSPEIDASKFTLHILSDTRWGFQWQIYILLMFFSLSSSSRHPTSFRNHLRLHIYPGKSWL